MNPNTLANVKPLGGEKRQGPAKKLKLAITKTGAFGNDKWDDMGKLLKELGEVYSNFDEITEQDLILLHEKNQLKQYDVIFLTCHPSREVDKLKEPLSQYVANGGILYASDWRYDAVAAAFPDMAVNNLVGSGNAEIVKADVVDPALREALGSNTIPLKFDLPEWKTAAFGGPRVQTLIQGKYRKYKSNVETTAPLMVKFQMDKGTVIFTSFHNEKQNSRVEKQLLEYLVFSLVTAGIDAELSSSMDKEGFTPQGSNLLSTPPKGKVEKKYDNPRPCTLRFALGFRDEGYQLRFNIKSPSGKQFTKDAYSTIILDVENAESGSWTYTVEALNAPPNFAFRTSVGEKK